MIFLPPSPGTACPPITRQWFRDAVAAALPGPSCPLPVLVGNGPEALAIEVPFKVTPRTGAMGWATSAPVVLPVGGVPLAFRLSFSLRAVASPKWQ